VDKPIIALDADGVLIDYNQGYAAVWQAAFGETLTLKHPDMHHAFNAYDCVFRDDAEKAQFYGNFTAKFWTNMPILEGAREACLELVDMGYELVCVTTMPPEFEAERMQNFLSGGLPISKTYATGRDKSLPAYNAKEQILRKLRPRALVDDYAMNFVGLEGTSIHRALIYRNQPDSPNHEMLHIADSQHQNLHGFVDFWRAHVVQGA
jgi:phosphoglycolate phosphatase-like HAD superfamily hydrolase